MYILKSTSLFIFITLICYKKYTACDLNANFTPSKNSDHA